MGDDLKSFFCFLEELIKDVEEILQMGVQNKLRAVKDKAVA